MNLIFDRVISPVRFGPGLSEGLRQLVPELGSISEHGCALEVGTRYGWLHVEVEYSFSSVCASESENRAEAATERVVPWPGTGSSFASGSAGTGAFSGKIKVSRARYDEWIQRLALR
jgi:hypothetical protein